jgi:hypothetical protein
VRFQEEKGRPFCFAGPIFNAAAVRTPMTSPFAKADQGLFYEFCSIFSRNRKI